MDKLIIPVNSKHFKDNAYQHLKDRNCPLSEAIEEHTGIRHLVGFSRVYENIHDSAKHVYNISVDDWNPNIVSGYISRANEGEEFTVNVELTKTERI